MPEPRRALTDHFGGFYGGALWSSRRDARPADGRVHGPKKCGGPAVGGARGEARGFHLLMAEAFAFRRFLPHHRALQAEQLPRAMQCPEPPSSIHDGLLFAAGSL